VTAQGNPVPVEDRLRAIQSITDAALSRLDDRDEPARDDIALLMIRRHPQAVDTRG